MSENTGVQVVPIEKIFLTGWNPRGEEAYQGVNVKAVEKVIAVFEGKPVPKGD